jgi:hypothetical protein
MLSWVVTPRWVVVVVAVVAVAVAVAAVAAEHQQPTDENSINAFR